MICDLYNKQFVNTVLYFVMFFYQKKKLEKISRFFLVAGPDPDPRSGSLLDLDPDPYK